MCVLKKKSPGLILIFIFLPVVLVIHWNMKVAGKKNITVNDEKKYVYVICHSSQMMCHHLGIGKATLREKESFGIVPVDKTDAGQEDPLFIELNNPFYGADFRKYEVITPDQNKIREL